MYKFHKPFNRNMASKTAFMAQRLGARAAQRSAARAAVLPAKEASMGLRNFTSGPRNVAALSKKSTLSVASPSSQRRYISERPDGRGKVYEFEDVRPRPQQRYSALFCVARSACSSGTNDAHTL